MHKATLVLACALIAGLIFAVGSCADNKTTNRGDGRDTLGKDVNPVVKILGAPMHIPTMRYFDCPPEGENLLPSGDFEKNDGGWKLFANGAGKAVETPQILDSSGMDRSRGLLLRKFSAETKGDVVYVQSPEEKLEAGKWYELGAYVGVRQMGYSTRLSTEAVLTSSSDKTKKPIEIKIPSPGQLLPVDGGKKWIYLNRDFQMPEGYDTASVRISLVNGDGEVHVDNVSLTLLKEGYERKYEPPAVDEPALDWDKSVSLLPAEKVGFDCGFDNRQPFFSLGGVSGEPVMHSVGSHLFDKYRYGEISRAGIRIHAVTHFLFQASDGKEHASFWIGKDKYDFSDLDRRIRLALGRNPEIRVILSFNMNPYESFGDLHPEECWLDGNRERLVRKNGMGKTAWRLEKRRDDRDYFCYSFASKSWYEEGAAAMAAMWKHINASDYANAVVGVHLSGAMDGQMFPWTATHGYGVRGTGGMDFSKSQLEYFRGYLRKKYGNDLAALRKSWRDEKVTFDTAEFPGLDDFDISSFLDGGVKMPVVDCREANYDAAANAYEVFAKAVKQAAGKDVLVCAWYPDGITGGVNNHYATRRLLQSPYLDALICHSYYGPDRLPGSPGGIQAAVDSYRLHNKIHVIEWDHRTWLSPFHRDDAWLSPAHDAEEFADIMRREAGIARAHSAASWFFEMDPGWYRDDGLLQEIKHVTNFMRPGKAAGLAGFEPEVAVFADESMQAYLAESSADIHNISNRHATKALNYSGVPYRVYFQEDLTHPKLPDYKLYIFLNAVSIPQEQRRFIEEKLKRDGKTLFWIYAPGCADTADPGKTVSDLTGMNVVLKSRQPRSSKALVDSSDSLTRNLITYGNGSDLALGNRKNYLNLPYSASALIFSVEDPDAITLARHTVDGSVCTAVRRFKNWTSVYAAIPGGFNPQFINNLAREAGAFVAAEAGDAVYLSDTSLVIHGCSANMQKEIKLPQACRIVDPVTGEVYSPRADKIVVDVPCRKTRWFYLQPAGR